MAWCRVLPFLILFLTLISMKPKTERYTFYLDGEQIEATYLNAQYGFCYHFVMPAHDVKFTWKSRNIMVKE